MKVEITKSHIIIVDTNVDEKIPINGLTDIQLSHVANIKSFSSSLISHENNLNTLV
jgi:hypothetical protein